MYPFYSGEKVNLTSAQSTRLGFGLATRMDESSAPATQLQDPDVEVKPIVTADQALDIIWRLYGLKVLPNLQVILFVLPICVFAAFGEKRVITFYEQIGVCTSCMIDVGCHQVYV